MKLTPQQLLVQVVVVIGLCAVAWLTWVQIREIWEPTPTLPRLVAPSDMKSSS